MKVDVATMYESLPLQMVTLAPPPMIADTDDLDSAMPAGLLRGRDAERVSRYVARVAGRRG